VAPRGAGARSGRLNVLASIRPGAPRDVAWLIDLGRRTLGDSLTRADAADAARVAEGFDRLIEFALEREHVLLVAEDGLEPLGFVLFLTDMPDEVTGLAQAFVVYVAVEPHAQRRGIGRRLFLAAEDAARERGLPYLAFMVTEDNLAAREMYAQLGYATERRQLCKRL
jgi:ribosomal protein S18 acetylase RimI-like enzyme